MTQSLYNRDTGNYRLINEARVRVNAATKPVLTNYILYLILYTSFRYVLPVYLKNGHWTDLIAHRPWRSQLYCGNGREI